MIVTLVLKRAAPWLVAVAILVVIALRVPYASFRTAIVSGPHLTLAAVDLGAVAFSLFTDTIAAWVAMIAIAMRRPFWHVLAVRGATFVLFIINYALAQGGFGYYLNRTGASALRATGATLFLIGTNFAALLLVTAGATAFEPVDPRLWTTIIALCGAFTLYLVVIALRPARLARIELLSPLFDAGLRGHAMAIAVRIPHVIAMSIGAWAALRAWGIAAPLSTAFTLMPIVIIASALPIAPAGLGTTQAALVVCFGAFAHGGDGEVLAFSIVHFVYNLLAILVVGIACVPLARRSGLVPMMKEPK